MAASLADALQLMHRADQGFGSVRMVVREWSHHERLQRAWTRHAERFSHGTMLVALPGGEEPSEPQPEDGTERTRVWWRKPDHVRLEHDDGDGGTRIEVAAGDRWWSWASDWGAMSNDQDPDVRGEAQQAPFPQLLQPQLLLAALRLELVGSGLQAGRRAIALRGVPRPEDHAGLVAHLALGADAHDLMVDAERGVLLRVASEIDGEPFAIAEVEEIAFDEAFGPRTFTLDLPPGEAFQPLRGQAPQDVTLDEAARRAPFTVLAPPRIPRGAQVWITMVEASERPPAAAQVGISYHVERGGFSLTLTQAAIDDADDRGLVGDGELVERDGRAVRWRRMGNQVQLETEHLGTHVFAMSDSMPADTLIDLMLSLEPAPTEPPQLV